MRRKTLAEKLFEAEINMRLVNWGRWNRRDNTYKRLGYPTRAAFVQAESRGIADAVLDAIHIEDIVRSLHLSGYPKAVRHAFILKVEYIENPEDQVPDVSIRAADVRRHFKMKTYSSRSYWRHLAMAKTAVRAFAEPIK